MEKKVSEYSGDDSAAPSSTMIDVVFQQKGDAMFGDYLMLSLFF